MEKFAFEELDIYHRSLNFVMAIRKLSKSIKTDFDILDQLRRSALSVSLNLVEGSGRFHKNEKRQFYYIARGSLFECIPILAILLKENLITQEKYEKAYAESSALSKMMAKLIKSLEKG